MGQTGQWTNQRVFTFSGEFSGYRATGLKPIASTGSFREQPFEETLA
jgi:hypothetical protein